MPNQSLSNSQVQKGTLSAGSIQLQQLLISQNYEIEQIVNQELSQNPALVIEDEPISPEDITPDEDDKEIWNQDFDKPYDEYETGERLKSEENSYRGDYDIASGLEVWSQTIGGARSIESIVATEDSVSVRGDFSSRCYLLDAIAGDVIEARDVNEHNCIWFRDGDVTYEESLSSEF